jgi:hypothetical protein
LFGVSKTSTNELSVGKDREEADDVFFDLPHVLGAEIPPEARFPVAHVFAVNSPPSTKQAQPGKAVMFNIEIQERASCA